MLTKRTVVSQLEITEAGTIQVRLEKQVVEDGVVLSKEYHRTVVAPGESAADVIAEVNRHLKDTKHAELEDHEVARVQRIAAVEHRPAVVAAFAELRRAHDEVRKAENTKGANVAAAMASAESKYRDLVETVRRKP
jgi:hypothetical protein